MNQERHLNFSHFLDKRSVQIGKFLTELELDTKKKGHQGLPKSIRRRAMSHNRYRIPLKMRRSMEEELAKGESMQKLPKCRKHIRKRRNLVTAYKLRNNENKWLSTHLWAAKRMNMVKHYGYKIANTPNDKSFRSSYRHFRHNNCLLDLSYYQVLHIRSENTVNQEIPPNFILDQGQKIPEFGKIYEVGIYKDTKKEKFICPAYLLRSLDVKNTWSIRCFFHPACLQQIKEMAVFEGFSVTFQSQKVDLYMLIGPQSGSTLSQALSEYGITEQNIKIEGSEKSLKNVVSYINPRDSCNITNKPSIDFPLREEMTLRAQYNSHENNSLRKKMFQFFDKINKKEEQEQASSLGMINFWKYYEQGQNKNLQETVFKITTRSRYTHKRKNKLSKQQKKQILKVDKSSQKKLKKPKQSGIKEDNQMSSQSAITEKVIFIENAFKKTACVELLHPIALCRLWKSDLFQGYLIFCSNDNNCKFWRILTHKNVKVIGRREYAHILLESNQLLFPENYANTLSYENYFQQKAQQYFRKYLRIPRPKRPHYLQINSPYGFFNHDDLSGCRLIALEMVSRGRCFPYSYVCSLQTQDLTFISQRLSSGCVGIVTSEQENQLSQRKEYKQIGEIRKELVACVPKRKIIGVVTGGGYKYSRSLEGGVGYLTRWASNPQYFSKFGRYVLIRKITSRHYMLGQITHFFNDFHMT